MAAVIPDLKTQWLKDGFAVEILDLDLPTASEEELLAFDELCRRYAVVVVRGQNLSPKQVVDVSSRLGRVSPQNYTGPHPDFPGISILSNKMVDGKLIGVRDAGRNWHTDGTTYQTLGLRTMLYGVECPPEGSDTLLADAAAAFDALPEERQAELEKGHSQIIKFDNENTTCFKVKDFVSFWIGPGNFLLWIRCTPAKRAK